MHFMGAMRFVIALLLSCSIVTSVAFPAFGIEQEPSRTCVQLLNLTPSILSLPPKAQVFMIGVLAESESGEHYLGLSDYYWGSHEEIYRAMSEKYPLKRILWGGELLIENNQNEISNGVVVLSINTSGYVTKRISQGHRDVNDPELLKTALMNHEPKLSASASQFFRFERSDAYLDPLFRDIHKRLGPDAPAGAVRHQFRDILNSIYLLYRRNTLPGISPDLQALSRMSSRKMNDILTFMESEARYSVLSQLDHIRFPNRSENIQELRETETRDEDFFKKINEHIANVGPRLNPTKIDVEIIKL